MAHLALIGSTWGCSGEALEHAELGAANGDRRDDDGDAARSSLEPLVTAIRVVNFSAEVRSRYTPCTGSYTIGIRPAAVDSTPRSPTCTPIDCATLNPGEVLTPVIECSAVACAPSRLDLPPGAADADFDWDGRYLTLTKRNCYDPTTFEPGTPMLAHVCFGKPAAGDYDVQGYTCTDHPFAYGAALLEIELQ